MIEERIKKIVEYLKESEETHFYESDKPENHIFIDVLAVEKWLNDFSPEQKICSCGQAVKLTLQKPFGGQEGDRFVGFCPKCRTRWALEDGTSEYEEMIMNEDIDPENGEYKNFTDNLWYYKDGECME